MSYLTEILNVFSIILTGFFGIYGLLHEYKDKSGRITRNGKIAVYGILVSATISVIGIGVNLKKAKDQELKQRESFEAELKRYNITLNEIKRLAYPLTDLIVEESYELSDTNKEFIDFKKYLISLINSIKISREQHGIAINLPSGVYDSWENNELTQISFDKGFTHFPKLSPPTQILCITDTTINMETLNIQKNQEQIDVLLTSPIYENNNLIDKRLIYNTKTNRFLYKIKFKPTPFISTGRIISHKDLKITMLGISILLPEFHKSWMITKIIFLNTLGFRTEVEMKTFKILEKSWPEITMYGKIK